MMNTNTYYRFGKQACATVPAGIDGAMLTELWSGFSFRMGTLDLIDGAENRIGFGNAAYLPVERDEEYTVCIRPDGIGIVGRDPKSLMRGFCALIARIELDESEKDTFAIPSGDIRGRYTVARRMIHLCVFPETDLSMLQRLVRLCGVLSYTHLVLEFWGMLKYDCLDALAWPNAFSKEQIKPIIREARACGLEVIPMINHLGHASACRIDTGKHVVLDQDPTLQALFTPDGWCWNIRSARVHALLREMRRELYELFGKGEYFHIGCDEAHFFSGEGYPQEHLCDYLRDLTDEIVSEGRRPILWGDMILPYDCNSDNASKKEAAWKRAEQMHPLMEALNRQSVIADWHYDIKTAPVPTVLEYQKAGFDVLGCPWDMPANIDAQYTTATEYQTYGLMMTTWHTLYKNMSAMVYFAHKCGCPKPAWVACAGHRNLEIATLLRKVAPYKLSYEECGFCHRQTKDTIDW